MGEQKRTSMALSNIGLEYMALSKSNAKVVWLQKLLVITRFLVFTNLTLLSSMLTIKMP
jgi:hypothetical protein